MISDAGHKYRFVDSRYDTVLAVAAAGPGDVAVGGCKIMSSWSGEFQYQCIYLVSRVLQVCVGAPQWSCTGFHSQANCTAFLEAWYFGGSGDPAVGYGL